MQDAYAPPMTTESPRHALRRMNLEVLINDPRVGSAAHLCELLGKASLSTHISAIRKQKRGMGDKLAMDIEDVTGKQRGWMDTQHTFAGENPPPWHVAQSMSYPERYDDLPLYLWENIIKTKPLPDTFRTVLPDDAMAPKYPQGTEIVWTSRRRVAPGRLLLLSDAHGQLHARLCTQGHAPGHWLAVPSNAAFVTLDNQSTPGLAVVAVYKGVLEPDDA